MNKRIGEWRIGVFGLGAAFVVGCGGGGGGGGADNPPSGSVPLSSKSDVVREIGNLISGTEILLETIGILSAESLSAGRTSDHTAQPKVAMTETCQLSGTVTRDTGTKTRSFPYFNVSRSVNFWNENASRCEQSNGTGSTRATNGFTEDGNSTFVQGQTSYSYTDWGQGSSPEITSVLGPGSDDYEVSLLGSGEETATQTAREVRAVLRLQSEGTIDGESFSDTIIFGGGSSPLSVLLNDSQGTVSVNGLYSYTSSECSGGELSATTAVPVSFEETTGAPNGGQVLIASGSNSVLVTFQLDGGATFQIQGGASGAMTPAELEAAIEEGC